MTRTRASNQRQKILHYLRTHKKGLSKRDMILRMNIGSPTKRISELREQGFRIIGTRVTVTGDDGEPTHYNIYTLKEEKK